MLAHELSVYFNVNQQLKKKDDARLVSSFPFGKGVYEPARSKTNNFHLSLANGRHRIRRRSDRSATRLWFSDVACALEPQDEGLLYRIQMSLFKRFKYYNSLSK